MKLRILAVGHRPPAWVDEGCREYLRRMPRELRTSIVEIRPEPRGSKTREQLLTAEKARLLAAAPAGQRIVALDERGADLTTARFAERLGNWMHDGRDTALIIGSADGLDESLIGQADESIRLSSLTLPHGLARLLLCEQIYRAACILRNHPYHREG